MHSVNVPLASMKSYAIQALYQNGQVKLTILVQTEAYRLLTHIHILVQVSLVATKPSDF